MIKKLWIIAILLGLTAGLLAQFVWKMIYFPEPIVPVVIELVFIITLTSSAIYAVVKI